MNIAFWSIVAVDAALFLGLLISAATQSGANSSGGREMGMFFFGIVPLVFLALAALLYHYSRAPVWKYLALVLVLGPGLLYAGSQIRGSLIDYRIRQNQSGRGYFKESALKSLGAAVVQGDVATLRRLAPGVDLNTVGNGDMTLIRLAADQVPSNELGSERVRATVGVVEELLRLGAAPEPALDISLKTDDPLLLRVLLENRANPNTGVDRGEPVVFKWLSVMPASHLQLLIGKGLDVNVMQYGTSLALTSALSRRFDLVLVLARSGADLRKPRDDGRTVASEIASRRDEAKNEQRDPAPELAPIEAILATQIRTSP